MNPWNQLEPELQLPTELHVNAVRNTSEKDNPRQYQASKLYASHQHSVYHSNMNNGKKMLKIRL